MCYNLHREVGKKSRLCRTTGLIQIQLAYRSTGSPGAQVHRSQVSLSYALLRRRKRYCQRVDHVEVATLSHLQYGTTANNAQLCCTMGIPEHGG